MDMDERDRLSRICTGFILSQIQRMVYRFRFEPNSKELKRYIGSVEHQFVVRRKPLFGGPGPLWHEWGQYVLIAYANQAHQLATQLVDIKGVREYVAGRCSVYFEIKTSPRLNHNNIREIPIAWVRFHLLFQDSLVLSRASLLEKANNLARMLAIPEEEAKWVVRVLVLEIVSQVFENTK